MHFLVKVLDIKVQEALTFQNSIKKEICSIIFGNVKISLYFLLLEFSISSQESRLVSNVIVKIQVRKMFVDGGFKCLRKDDSFGKSADQLHNLSP